MILSPIVVGLLVVALVLAVAGMRDAAVAIAVVAVVLLVFGALA